MKLVSYLKEDNEQLAILENGRLYDTDELHPSLPSNMKMFLDYWDDVLPCAQSALKRIQEGSVEYKGVPFEDQELMAPVPFPRSVRDGYAFRQHVATARRNRHAEMPPEFDQFPVFYFTNHNSVTGAGEITCMPDHLIKLDFELECAIVICRSGRNIRAKDADKYIGGYMIMNDFSARFLQAQEMKLHLGPAKGKDFATAFGPYLVTRDELEKYKTKSPAGHNGNAYSLSMKAFVNGIQVSEGNFKDMNWTFAEIIERASYGVQLSPGDVIGSGTVGTGCFLEINGTNKLNDPTIAEQWLEPGDVVSLQIDGLGKLENEIVEDPDHFSILEQQH